MDVKSWFVCIICIIAFIKKKPWNFSEQTLIVFFLCLQIKKKEVEMELKYFTSFEKYFTYYRKFTTNICYILFV